MKHYLDHFEIIRVEETDSTNAAIQTGGKGQRGNSWESERGKNLLFTISCRPTFLPARQQFLLSQAIALSVFDTFRRFVRRFSIKWPNDIYWRDRKVGGILIENDLAGEYIAQSIIGVGLNINQTEFRSDAPNPASILQVCGMHCKRRHVLEHILKHFEAYYRLLQQGKMGVVREHYREALFRKNGFHTYRDEQGEFSARLHHVEDDGHLILEDSTGRLRTYAFKELTYVF